ncbi:hypothetical protein GIB67_025290 [Kingdonia uniflora]|uniref:Xyloglucan endotransglucosylase/hydrolase n=1 Tax=Kingdonia uniflora TaxID=39325 RepID=A0A7J7NBN5_9MAGN|nr:hypothetical protein GIB67_025290 [Kingdonia uniflora]
MGRFQALFLALVISLIAFNQNHVGANFSKSMYFTWGAQHSYFSADGENVQLVLDKSSGITISAPGFSQKDRSSSAASKSTCWILFDTIMAQLSSKGDRHDEIDFEFLGNVSGQPYIIHTNVYTEGKGNREVQFHPWFNPTADFHNYTIHWNPHEIVWFVDGLPIRVFRNYELEGVPFPNKQGMMVYSSLWNADNWATRGGKDKIDWISSPFVAKFQRFRARACKWDGPISISQCASISQANWWTSQVYSKLSYAQMGQMKWVQDHYMIYDYCKDTTGRFYGKIPLECSKQQF